MYMQRLVAAEAAVAVASTIAVGSATGAFASPSPTAPEVGAIDCFPPQNYDPTKVVAKRKLEVWGRTLELRNEQYVNPHCSWGRLINASPGDKVWVNRNGHDMSGQGGQAYVQAGKTAAFTPKAFENGPSAQMNACFKAHDRPNIFCTELFMPSPVESPTPTASSPSSTPTAPVTPTPTEAPTTPTKVPSPASSSGSASPGSTGLTP